jgi:hypothetical protein
MPPTWRAAFTVLAAIPACEPGAASSTTAVAAGIVIAMPPPT